MVNFSDIPDLEPPRWLGVRELNLGDRWRARWIEGEPLPAGVLVDHAYVGVLHGDRGYVCRRHGDEVWGTAEGGPSAGEKPEPLARRLAREQAGATPSRVDLIGFLDCRATSHHPEHPAGTRAVRPFYLVGAKRVAPSPGDAAFERRRLPLNEFMQALRRRYPEFEEYMGKLLERYVVLHARGEVD